jgi:hypothetical protein
MKNSAALMTACGSVKNDVLLNCGFSFEPNRWIRWYAITQAPSFLFVLIRHNSVPPRAE